MWCFATLIQSLGVVSPKEVFMNVAAAAIPETRSDRIHQ